MELTNYASQAGDTCLLTNAMETEEAYEGGPQESGSVRFKTIECHVALDVHAMVRIAIVLFPDHTTNFRAI